MGKSLLETICHATGLPYDMVYQEVETLIKDSGLNLESVTVDEFREVLAEYLQDVLLNAKQHYS